MSQRVASPCSHPGCPNMAIPGTGRCAAHQRSPRRDDRLSPSARGYDREWQRIRAAYLRRNPWCVMCGARATQVDHILPLARGGTHDASNLESLCASCHSRKTAQHDGAWGRGG